jgi:hypothetical protein
MEFRANRSKIAGSTKQELPTEEVGTRREDLAESFNSSKESPRSRRSGTGAMIDIRMSVPMGQSGATADDVAPSSSSPAPLDQPRAAQFEPLQSQITSKVQSLLQADAGGLEVTLKPVGLPEVKLRLVREAGRVEALAHCKAGDFDTLNSGWTELRSALAGQGIQLQPLREMPPMPAPAAPQTGGDSSHSNQHERPRTPTPTPTDPADRCVSLPSANASAQRVFFSGTTTRSIRSQSSTLRLLESWA